MTKPTEDSAEYLARKAFYSSLLTVYGRKPVLEALQSADARPYRLHLADSNRPAGILDEITQAAINQGAEVLTHSRQALSRISKNARQDQGVCVDLHCPRFQTLNDFLSTNSERNFELLALDGITNPQNLGMIIRSATAGFVDGILLPENGGAQIDPLVIKASAGTVFKAPILRCGHLSDGLKSLQKAGAKVYKLAGDGEQTLAELSSPDKRVFVLGNETKGVSERVANLADHSLAIPMNNGVESLNVAVTAALLAFRTLMR